MSDGYLYLDDEDEAAAAPSRSERLLKRLAVVVAAALAAELAWFLVAMPCLPMNRIDFELSPGLDRSRVVAATGLGEASSYLGTDAAAIERALEALPEIASARVEKAFPDRIVVAATARVPLALCLAEKDGRTVPVVFDREGVVFAVGAAAAAYPGCPIVSGLKFDVPAPGARLPAFLDGFLADLDRIARESPAVLEGVSEIRVQQRAYDGFELVVYPASRPVRVRVGSRLNEEVLRYMMLVLDVLASQGIDADEIDFRAGAASYRAKEASTG